MTPFLQQHVQSEAPISHEEPRGTASLPDPQAQPAEQLSEERTERRRQQMVIRSRRKRERQKDYVKSLQDQIPDLRASNESYRQDNARLEGLLREAEQLIQNVAMYR